MRHAGKLLAGIGEHAADLAKDRAERQRRCQLDPRDFDALRELGLHLATVPVAYGGLWENQAASLRPLCEAYRTLATGDASLALAASMHAAVLSHWRDPEPPARGAAAWNGHGMAATNSHAFAFDNFPATRVAGPGSWRALSEAAGGAAGITYTSVVVGVVDAAMAYARLPAPPRCAWVTGRVRANRMGSGIPRSLAAATGTGCGAARIGNRTRRTQRRDVGKAEHRIVGRVRADPAMPYRRRRQLQPAFAAGFLVRGCSRLRLPAPALVRHGRAAIRPELGRLAGRICLTATQQGGNLP